MAHPAQEALARLGAASVAPLIEILGGESAYARSRAESALWDLAATDAKAAQAIRDARDGAGEPLRARIEHVLELAGG